MKTQKLTIEWSDFAHKQNLKGHHSQFTGHQAELIALVKKHWRKRKPGTGRSNLSQVVVVPIVEKELDRYFQTPWGMVSDSHHLRAKAVRRQDFEDPYVEVHGRGERLPVKFAKVVLYSAATLLEDGGTRSTDADWEIVAILAGPWKNEPMSPLTMARNFLRKPGGTYAPYTAEQFAESIYFWSTRVKVK